MSIVSHLLRFTSKLRAAVYPKSAAATAVNEEIRNHIDLLTEQYRRQGKSAEEARWEAQRQFGNVTLLQEQQSEERGFHLLDTLWRDLRYGARQLRRNPLFTTVAITSLALGIGANTAMFTLLDQLVLRMLPVQHPEKLVMIWSTGPNLGSNTGSRSMSYPMYQDFQRQAKAFQSVFCRYETPLAVTSGGATERVHAELVSGNYFQALGVRAALGRVFTPAQDDRTYMGHPSVVLNYHYWVNRFARDKNVIGRKILINNYPMEIAGVAAEEFGGLDPSHSPYVWIPMQMEPVMIPGQNNLGNRRRQWIQVFARLAPGYTVDSARASLQPLFHRVLEDELTHPKLQEASPYERAQFLRRSAIVETAANGYSDLRGQYSTALIVLMLMATLMLLIACSNVANLLIARSAARSKEIAIRLSLGAGRGTLVRQFLAESVMLALASATLGLVLAFVTTQTLLSMLPEEGGLLLLQAKPDGRVLLFSIAVALFTSLLFGLAPALQATKQGHWSTLKNAASAITGGRSPAFLRKGLVMAQVAMSFLLITSAGLFMRTLSNLNNFGSGLKQIDTLITFEIDPSANGYNVARLHSFYSEVHHDLEQVPGVQSAGYALNPLLRGYHSDATLMVQGYRPKDGEDMSADVNAVSPDYWKTMGVRLVQGKDFDGSEPAHTSRDQYPTAVIVNRKFAEHFFGRRNPIGRKIDLPGRPVNQPQIPIIGVVENTLHDGPRNGIPREVFFTYSQVPAPESATFYVRAREGFASLAAIRDVVAKRDAAVPVYDLKTLQRQMDETLSTERLIASLSVAFGAIATLLAAMGLYGVMAFIVAFRTKEIGLRMALGASQYLVLWTVAREALLSVGCGLLIGIVCAYPASHYIASQLFGVTPTDLWTCLSAVAILGFAAAISAFVPARRASTIDPIVALRCE